MKKNVKVGIIAEDDSDVSSIKVIINRISGRNIGVESFVGRGCGNIKKKCGSWVNTLKLKGCSILVIIHDSDFLDSSGINSLKNEINRLISPCPISKNIIVIPVQELEAWFLSDPDGIKSALNLKKLPNIQRNPEFIDSPREFLEDLVLKTSQGEKIYIHTKHNGVLSNHTSLDLMKQKCSSFLPFFEFISSNIV